MPIDEFVRQVFDNLPSLGGFKRKLAFELPVDLLNYEKATVAVIKQEPEIISCSDIGLFREGGVAKDPYYDELAEKYSGLPDNYDPINAFKLLLNKGSVKIPVVDKDLIRAVKKGQALTDSRLKTYRGPFNARFGAFRSVPFITVIKDYLRRKHYADNKKTISDVISELLFPEAVNYYSHGNINPPRFDIVVYNPASVKLPESLRFYSLTDKRGLLVPVENYRLLIIGGSLFCYFFSDCCEKRTNSSLTHNNSKRSIIVDAGTPLFGA